MSATTFMNLVNNKSASAVTVENVDQFSKILKSFANFSAKNNFSLKPGVRELYFEPDRQPCFSINGGCSFVEMDSDFFLNSLLDFFSNFYDPTFQFFSALGDEIIDFDDDENDFRRINHHVEYFFNVFTDIIDEHDIYVDVKQFVDVMFRIIYSVADETVIDLRKGPSGELEEFDTSIWKAIYDFSNFNKEYLTDLTSITGVFTTLFKAYMKEDKPILAVCYPMWQSQTKWIKGENKWRLFTDLNDYFKKQRKNERSRTKNSPTKKKISVQRHVCNLLFKYINLYALSASGFCGSPEDYDPSDASEGDLYDIFEGFRNIVTEPVYQKIMEEQPEKVRRQFEKWLKKQESSSSSSPLSSPGKRKREIEEIEEEEQEEDDSALNMDMDMDEDNVPSVPPTISRPVVVKLPMTPLDELDERIVQQQKKKAKVMHRIQEIQLQYENDMAHQKELLKAEDEEFERLVEEKQHLQHEAENRIKSLLAEKEQEKEAFLKQLEEQKEAFLNKLEEQKKEHLQSYYVEVPVLKKQLELIAKANCEF